MLDENIYVLQCEIELFDYCDLLIVEVNLMLCNYLKQGSRYKTAEQLFMSLALHHLKHPQDGVGAYDVRLGW